ESGITHSFLKNGSDAVMARRCWNTVVGIEHPLLGGLLLRGPQRVTLSPNGIPGAKSLSHKQTIRQFAPLNIPVGGFLPAPPGSRDTRKESPRPNSMS